MKQFFYWKNTNCISFTFFYISYQSLNVNIQVISRSFIAYFFSNVLTAFRNRISAVHIAKYI